jgi:hypothetical protein
VITLIGPLLTFSLTLFLNHTSRGQLTIELSSSISSFFYVLVISWFIGRVFAGSLLVSLETVLISAACDEEMFTREQRFIEQDLLDFMDGIGEEQNEQHKEHKMKVRIIREEDIATDRWDEKEFKNNQVLPFKENWGDDRSNASRVDRSAHFSPDMIFSPPERSFRSFMNELQESAIEENDYRLGTPAVYLDDES